MIHIKTISIKKNIREKILKRHNITKEEIEQIIFEDLPIYLRARNNKYMCIGNKNKYVTIILKFRGGVGEIITAYKSSKWQRKLHRRKI